MAPELSNYDLKLGEAVCLGVPYHRTAETCDWSYEKTHDDPCHVHTCGKCAIAIGRVVERVVLEHSPEVRVLREELIELRFLRPYVVANEQVMQAAWTARRIFRDACTGTAMPDAGVL